MNTIKWITLENESGERSLKQHAFRKEQSYHRYTGEEYEGNISICKKIWAGNGNEEVEYWDKLESELMHPECCKVCAKMYKIICDLK